MALLTIIKYPDPRLKIRSAEVTVFDDALRENVRDMAETMYAAPGVGLAAVQAGIHRRILVMDAESGEPNSQIEVFINPVILEGKGSLAWEEGCLSLPDFTEEVTRKEWIKVRYQDVRGAFHESELEGFRAVIFQHELDHLDGILATDRVSRLKRSLYQRKRSRALREEEQVSANV